MIKVKWRASDELRLQELQATGRPGPVEREVVIDLAQAAPVHRKRWGQLFGPELEITIAANGQRDYSGRASETHWTREPTLELILSAANIEKKRQEAAIADAEQARAKEDGDARALFEAEGIIPAKAAPFQYTIQAAKREISSFRSDAERSRFGQEMTRWADEHGSDHLRYGIQRGYDMTRTYVYERAEKELPQWHVDFGVNATSQERTSPSPDALKLLQKSDHLVEKGVFTDVIIVWLKRPPQTRAGEPAIPNFESQEAIQGYQYLGRYAAYRLVHASEGPKRHRES